MNYKAEIAKLIKLGDIKVEEIESLLCPPKDSTLGDWALPCFRFAKELKKSPAVIADELSKAIVNVDFIEEIIAVNGYVNFKLNREHFCRLTLCKIVEDADNYGKSNVGEGKTICIDYSSVNIAKPFHLGHLSNTLLGASIYRTLKFLGYNVVGINHLGDWGTQFGKLITAYKLWGNREEVDKNGITALLELYVRFHKEENEEMLNVARDWFKKIEDNDKEAMSIFLWFKEITLIEVQKIYDRLNIPFDSFAGESFYNDKMQPVLDELENKNLLKISNGAKIVELGEDIPPCLIIKADGATLYATRDLAAAFYRKNTYNFYKCLYVVAYQQNLHFKQWFKVIDLMGYEWAKDLQHIAYGMVSLESGSLSTREGNVVFANDVLNEAVTKSLEIINLKNPNVENKEEIAESIGVGAVTFGMLSNNKIKDIVFSYDKMLNFEGETGVYVQYTYARCCSLLAKAESADNNVDYSGVADVDGFELLKLLEKFPSIIADAGEKYEPSIITRFAVDVAQAFNRFYLNNRILNAESAIKNARLILVSTTKNIINTAMGLLGINCPNKM